MLINVYNGFHTASIAHHDPDSKIYHQQNFSDFKGYHGYLLLVLTMEQTTDNTTKIKELTYEQWQELSDRLDQIQATLDKLFLVEIPKKNKKEDKK